MSAQMRWRPAYRSLPASLGRTKLMPPMAPRPPGFAPPLHGPDSRPAREPLQSSLHATCLFCVLCNHALCGVVLSKALSLQQIIVAVRTEAFQCQVYSVALLLQSMAAKKYNQSCCAQHQEDIESFLRSRRTFVSSWCCGSGLLSMTILSNKYLLVPFLVG